MPDLSTLDVLFLLFQTAAFLFFSKIVVLDSPYVFFHFLRSGDFQKKKIFGMVKYARNQNVSDIYAFFALNSLYALISVVSGWFIFENIDFVEFINGI